MFTGLIEEVGTVAAVHREGDYQRIEIEAVTVTADSAPGDSISLDGACQTVTSVRSGRFTVDTLAVTLSKTTLGEYRPGRRVNLERAVTPATRLGGHFVQGHVDGTGRVHRVRRDGHNVFLTVEVPPELLLYCVAEGSIAVEGISLTIAELHGSLVTINVIPVTWSATTLADRTAGERVNLEVDIIGRYVARMLGLAGAAAEPNSVLTENTLAQWGYH
jgi:riboflavin synthase